MCCNCEIGPYELDDIRTEYELTTEAYVERCPVCASGTTFAWADNDEDE